MAWEIIGRIRNDTDYIFVGLDKTKKNQRYHVTGFHHDPHGRQERVSYVGVNGSDAGVAFSCSPNDFIMNFVLAEEPAKTQEATTEPQSPAPAKGKVAGNFSKGACHS